jgi:hypothetical protein
VYKPYHKSAGRLKLLKEILYVLEFREHVFGKMPKKLGCTAYSQTHTADIAVFDYMAICLLRSHCDEIVIIHGQSKATHVKSV